MVHHDEEEGDDDRHNQNPCPCIARHVDFGVALWMRVVRRFPNVIRGEVSRYVRGVSTQKVISTTRAQKSRTRPAHADGQNINEQAPRVLIHELLMSTHDLDIESCTCTSLQVMLQRPSVLIEK